MSDLIRRLMAAELGSLPRLQPGSVQRAGIVDASDLTPAAIVEEHVEREWENGAPTGVEQARRIDGLTGATLEANAATDRLQRKKLARPAVAQPVAEAVRGTREVARDAPNVELGGAAVSGGNASLLAPELAPRPENAALSPTRLHARAGLTPGAHPATSGMRSSDAEPQPANSSLENERPSVSASAERAPVAPVHSEPALGALPEQPVSVPRAPASSSPAVFVALPQALPSRPPSALSSPAPSALTSHTPPALTSRPPAVQAATTTRVTESSAPPATVGAPARELTALIAAPDLETRARAARSPRARSELDAPQAPPREHAIDEASSIAPTAMASRDGPALSHAPVAHAAVAPPIFGVGAGGLGEAIRVYANSVARSEQGRATRALPDASAAAPVVRIRIGRIEVHAAPDAAAPAPAAVDRSQPLVSLQELLRRREES